MPIKNNSKTSRDTGRLSTGEQPEYGYEPWDSEQGGFRHLSNGENGYADARHDDDYKSPSNQGESTRGATQPDTTINNLRNAENNAISNREPSYKADDQDSFYTGKGKPREDSSNQKSGLRGKLKGKGAIITIALALLSGGVFLSTSNSLLAPALSALMTSSTQTSYTSYSLRVKHIMSGMMDDAGGAVTTGWTGAKKYSKIPNYMKKRLAQFDIEVEGTGKNTILRWNGEEIDAANFVNKINSDAKFREAYMKAKRGRVATFFDNVADKIYQKLGISRNLFKDYKQTNNPDVDTANYKNTMEPKFDGNTTDLNTHTTGEKQEPDVDADGNELDTTHPVEDPGPNTSGSATTGTSADPEVQAETMIQNIAQSVGQVGAWACTAMKVGNMIAIAAAAQEIYQSINYFMGLMENVSKMKYGEGDSSAINALLSFLTTSTTTQTTSDFGKLGVITVAQGTQPSISTVTETGAPVQASGIQKMLANTPVTSSNTANYSLERIIKTLGGVSMFGVTTVGVCAGVDIANSLISLATTVIPGGGVVKVIGNVLFKFTVAIAASATISAFFNFLVPTLAKTFFSNAFETATGIPAGHLLAQGGSAANMHEGRSGSGQNISGEEEVLEFAHQTNVVLAQDAEIDRATLSPFDTSNPNTFFGSIAYSLLPTITSTNMTGLASFLRSTATSLSSLMGGASAEGENSSYLTTYGDCPLLEEIGAVGDLYCNPIVTTDISTVNIEPTDHAYSDAMEDNTTNCDDEGNCDIDPKGSLAKYITYCDGRESPFGVVDQNILGALQTGGEAGTVLNSIPVVGDIMGIINAVEDINNVEWANGQKCGNTGVNSEFWESEGKYYQRYVEDQRILEQMGAYEGSTNPVLALEEKYEKQQAEKYADTNPIVAYYSRISGLNIENTETMLAFVAYYNHVDQYDPTTTIAMIDASEIDTSTEVVAKAMSEKINLDNNSDNNINTPPAYTVLTDKYIAYADLRNRSYAA